MKKKREKISKNNKIDIKKIINVIRSFIINNKTYIFLALPFFVMDLFTRLFGYAIGFYGIYRLVPNMFTLIWTMLFIGISVSFKSKYGRFVYLFFNILFLALFIVNNVYYSTTSNFFDFTLIESASEGSPYFMSTVLGANPFIYITALIVIILMIMGFKRFPKSDKNKLLLLTKIFVLFVLLHVATVLLLGSKDTELEWSTWRNPRNIYISFNDNNKSMRVSGLYEYSVRNFYITYLKTDQEINEENLLFLEESFTEVLNKKNSYTGDFKNKNLIIVQLEGIDNWLLTKQDTPTLYKMQKKSINFKNHYSFYNGGGSTFNSEFAVNTGYITPMSYTRNAYSFNKNSFPFSLAKIFKEKDYSINAFHMNTGEYYSRAANYKTWGYDNYYGLIDMFDYTNKNYELDRELILNTEFSDLMFPEDKKFVDYIITYSAHMPFSDSKDSVCKQLIELDKEEEKTSTMEVSTEEIEMTEEDCARRQASETDYFMKLLLDKLKEKGLYDDTVIVVFTDHYLYTLEDKSILEEYKDTDTNLINKTPFFIWSSSTKTKTIKTVTSQINILPTILNLFGVRYNRNNYIGDDALSSSYSKLVFFPDYSWYDGSVYVDGGVVINNKKISSSSLEEKNYYVNYITRKNDLTLKYNYFNILKKE